MKATFKRLECLAGRLSPISTSKPRVLQSYFGEGYGHPTPDGIRAAQTLLHRENIILDQTYTAKTFAAVNDYCIRHPEKIVLFWNTLNSIDLSSHLASLDRRMLPASLKKLIDKKNRT
jgi:1-aminocyclopropane-1-carboxylate deaminase/D-cysteine desulfhydrase-like pyridoxal-dependent ACC family enzyme